MNAFPLAIQGVGVISPCGVGANCLLEGVQADTAIEVSLLERERDGQLIQTPVRRVSPEARASMPRHPRIRRASPITKFALTALNDALADAEIDTLNPTGVGLVSAYLNGPVSCSKRFYGEVITEPQFASPNLFPETVFNAPASHLASILGIQGPAYTLVGDASAIYSALQVAEMWIATGYVEQCLVVAAEELDWSNAEALQLYGEALVATEGAAAFLVRAADSAPNAVRFESLAGPHLYQTTHERATACRAARAGLELGSLDATCLVDGQRGNTRLDRAEGDAWADWEGPRLSPYAAIGDGMGVGAGFQLAIAVARTRQIDGHGRVLISNPGSNLQAFAANLCI